jgi:hypothetical protein
VEIVKNVLDPPVSKESNCRTLCLVANVAVERVEKFPKKTLTDDVDISGIVVPNGKTDRGEINVDTSVEPTPIDPEPNTLPARKLSPTMVVVKNENAKLESVDKVTIIPLFAFNLFASMEDI